MLTSTHRRYFGGGDDASGYLEECKGYLKFMRRNEHRKAEVVYGVDTVGGKDSKDSNNDGSGGGSGTNMNDNDIDIDSDSDFTDDAGSDSLYTSNSVELLKKQMSLQWSLHLVADMLGNIAISFPPPLPYFLSPPLFSFTATSSKTYPYLPPLTL